jgi:hypothetical protein
MTHPITTTAHTDQLAHNHLSFRYMPAGLASEGSTIPFRTIESAPQSYRVSWENCSPFVKVTKDDGLAFWVRTVSTVHAAMLLSVRVSGTWRWQSRTEAAHPHLTFLTRQKPKLRPDSLCCGERRHEGSDNGRGRV